MNGTRFLAISLACLLLYSHCRHAGDLPIVHRLPDLKLETGISEKGVRFFRINESQFYSINNIEVYEIAGEEPIWQVATIKPEFRPFYFSYGQKFAATGIYEIIPPVPLQKGKRYVLKVCIAGDCDSLQFVH